MASRTRIPAVAFLSLVFLPLLASAFFPFIPGFSHEGLSNPLKNQDAHRHRVRLPIFPEPVFNENPLKQDEPEPQPEPEPEEKPGNGNGGPAAQTGNTIPGNGYGGLPAAQPPPRKGGNGNGIPAAQPEQPKAGNGNGNGNGVPAARPNTPEGALREGFYAQSCPQAEKIASEVIHRHFVKDPTIAPAFVRLFFHDCFVTGCDASILLDKTPTGEDVEKLALQNGPFVRGFDVIDDIKTQLEAACPGVVSCADILAFANRDSLVFTGIPNYGVAAGRRDSLASLAKNVDGNLPFPDTSAEENIKMFQKKGMSLEELVVLVGAHSVGNAHCSIVSGRFHDPEKAKDIDQGYLFKMQTLTSCKTDSQDLPFDPYTQQKMDSRFYKELLTNQALLESDHNLAKDGRTNTIMKKLVDDQNGWLAKFTSAIIKLGETEVLTGNQGEIRKQCRTVN